jgi:hypothetical protein
VCLVDVGSALESASMAFDGRRTVGPRTLDLSDRVMKGLFLLACYGGRGYGFLIDT